MQNGKFKVAVAFRTATTRGDTWTGFLKQGLEALGHKCVPYVGREGLPQDVDFAIFWGMKRRPRSDCRERQIPFLLLETHVFGPKTTHASLGWNDIAGRALRPAPASAPRLQPGTWGFEQVQDLGRAELTYRWGRMAPWKSDNTGKVMVFGQMPVDYAVWNVDITRWERGAAKEAAEWGREVIRRPHPNWQRSLMPARYPNEYRVRESHRVPLRQALADENVWLAVTYNSTSAVESVSAGIPTVAMDDGSMAWDVSSHAIGERKTPNREAWAHALSYCQWSAEEFATGQALEHLLPHFEAAQADAKNRPQEEPWKNETHEQLLQRLSGARA
jgi:hypothetical protein